jgi:hypothetical protein
MSLGWQTTGSVTLAIDCFAKIHSVFYFNNFSFSPLIFLAVKIGSEPRKVWVKQTKREEAGQRFVCWRGRKYSPMLPG